MLPDRNYFSSARLPFLLIDVTERAQPWTKEASAARGDPKTRNPQWLERIERWEKLKEQQELERSSLETSPGP